MIRVAWTVEFPDGDQRRPFNAIGMFLRLLSRTGAPATIAFASGAAHPDGRYAAEVSVPQGGIGGIRMGLRGTTGIFFPLENDPFTSPGAFAATSQLFAAHWRRSCGRTTVELQAARRAVLA